MRKYLGNHWTDFAHFYVQHFQFGLTFRKNKFIKIGSDLLDLQVITDGHASIVLFFDHFEKDLYR